MLLSNQLNQLRAQIRPRRWLWLTCLAPIPAALFLLQPGFFASSDGMIHLYRLFELDTSLHAGILFPRWFPLSGYGYGLPVLNYYPPLAYYLAEFFHLGGAGYIAAIKLLIAFSLFAAALSMFFFARDWLDASTGSAQAQAAFVAGVAYAYLPYVLSDAYVRGNFPELLAVSLLPLALYAFRRAFTNGSMRDVILAALAFAAIILTHHLTAMLFAALLAAYLLWLFVWQRKWKRLASCLAAILFALALSAFYWLPSLGELNLVYVGPASVAQFIVSRLVSFGDFFAPSLAYEYLPQSDALKHSAGFPQTIVALCAIVLLIPAFRNPKSEIRNLHLAFFFLVLLFALAMTLTISAPIWNALPPLRFLQFPWRFQILAGISIAILLGAWAQVLARFRAPPPLAALALIALALANLPVRAFPLTDAEVDLTRNNDSDYVLAQMGWGWTREFVPATVQEFENIVAPHAKAAPHAASIASPEIQIRDASAQSYRIASAQPFEFSLHTFFFPNWQAYIDSTPARTYPRGSLGLASVMIPAGDHVVEFRFEDTPIRAAANALSLIVAGGALARLFFTRRRAFIALSACVIAVVSLWLWHARDLPRANAPVAVSANLANQTQLIGYSTERAGANLHVTLNWIALSEMDRDYTSFVHLIGADNAILAQHDGPPNQRLTPTTRWLSGEIVTDRHALSLAGIAPGEYRIAAGMYFADERGYESISVVDASGKTIGEQVELGRVTIK